METMAAQVVAVVSVTTQLITVDRETRPLLLRRRAAMVVREPKRPVGVVAEAAVTVL